MTGFKFSIKATTSFVHNVTRVQQLLVQKGHNLHPCYLPFLRYQINIPQPINNKGNIPTNVTFTHFIDDNSSEIEISAGSGRRVFTGNSPSVSQRKDSVINEKLDALIPFRYIISSELLIQSASPNTIIRCS